MISSELPGVPRAFVGSLCCDPREFAMSDGSRPARHEPLPDGVDSRLVQEMSKVFSLLAEPTRLRIVLMLSRRGPMNVTDICEKVGQSQPAVSRHLGLMKLAGLLESEQRGKFNYYRVNYEVFRSLMNALRPIDAGHHNCECFLECVFGVPAEGRADS